jgi:hypothetical protein
MTEKERLDIQVYVYIVDEQSKKGTKKKSRDKGVQKYLEEFHQKKIITIQG